MQQLWAEALVRAESGEAYWLTAEENRFVAEHNEAFRSMDVVEERILSSYDDGALPCRYLSASQALSELGILNPKVGDMRKAGAVLRKLFKSVKRNGVVAYHMPALRSSERYLSPLRDAYSEAPL